MLLSPFETRLTVRSSLVVWATVAVALIAMAWPHQELSVRLVAPLVVLFSIAVTYGFWRIALTVLAKLASWKVGYYYSLTVYYIAALAVPLSIVAIPMSWSDPAQADLPKWLPLLGIPTALGGMVAAGEAIRGNYVRA